jgi:hypothetical protein
MLNKYVALLSFCIFSYVYPNISPTGFSQFYNHYFVETGTHLGAGIAYALQAKFPEIYSIELDAVLAAKAESKFKIFNNVHIITGDSGRILWDIIHDMNQPITFWLDGHNSSGVPVASGKKNTPLLDELEQIKLHPIKTHTILIDDIRLLGTWQFDFITKEMLIQKILEINQKYIITYIDGYCKDDIMVAQVPS